MTANTAINPTMVGDHVNTNKYLNELERTEDTIMTTVSGIKNIQQEMDANVMSRGKTTPLRILFVDMLRNDAFAGTGIGANKWVNTAADGAAKDLLNREPTSSTTRGRRTVQAGDTTDEEITSPLRQETEIRIGQRRLKDCCTRLKGRDVKWKNTGYIVTYLPPIPPWPPPISHCIPLTTKRKRLKEQPHKCKQLQLRGKGTRNALQQAGYALGITQSKMHLFIGWIELENLPTSQPPTHPLIRPLGARWNDERILSTILASCLNSGRRSSTKLVRTSDHKIKFCAPHRLNRQCSCLPRPMLMLFRRITFYIGYNNIGYSMSSIEAAATGGKSSSHRKRSGKANDPVVTPKKKDNGKRVMDLVNEEVRKDEEMSEEEGGKKGAGEDTSGDDSDEVEEEGADGDEDEDEDEGTSSRFGRQLFAAAAGKTPASTKATSGGQQQSIRKSMLGYENKRHFVLEIDHKQGQSIKTALQIGIETLLRELHNSFGDKAGLVTKSGTGGRTKTVTMKNFDKRIGTIKSLVTSPVLSQPDVGNLTKIKRSKKKEELTVTICIGSDVAYNPENETWFELHFLLADKGIQLNLKRFDAVESTQGLMVVNAIAKTPPETMQKKLQIAMDIAIAEHDRDYRSQNTVGFATPPPKVKIQATCSYPPGIWDKNSAYVKDPFNKKIWLLEYATADEEIIRQSLKYFKKHARKFVGRMLYTLDVVDMSDGSVPESRKERIKLATRTSSIYNDTMLYPNLFGFRTGGLDAEFVIIPEDAQSSVTTTARQLLMNLEVPTDPSKKTRYVFVALIDSPTDVDGVVPNGPDYRDAANEIKQSPAAFVMYHLASKYRASYNNIMIIMRKVFEPEAIQHAQTYAQFDPTSGRIIVDLNDADYTISGAEEREILDLDWMKEAQAEVNAANANRNGAFMDIDDYSDEGSLDTRAFMERRYPSESTEVDTSNSISLMEFVGRDASERVPTDQASSAESSTPVAPRPDTGFVGQVL